MLRSLRRRLILSHTLPLLIIIPLAGLALIYVIETQVLLPSISSELKEQAVLVADLVEQQPSVLRDSAEAQRLVESVASNGSATVDLFDAAGHVMASSNPSTVATDRGRRPDVPGIDEALRGNVNVHTVFSRNVQAVVADALAPIYGQSGQIVGAEAFNALQERLQNLEQTRAKLLANLVHELARPLGALLSAIQALQRGAREDRELGDELLAGMREETMRLQRLVGDLSHLHSRALGPLELHQQPTTLADWLPRTLAPWREMALARNLKWEAKITPDLPVAEIDPDRVAQALGNLLSNAIKFTPQGGKVEVVAQAEPLQAFITVADTGPGIPAEEQELVFGPFYRGNRLRRFPQGMGLGLTIARDVMLAHGGRLEMESSPGTGTRFTLRLPLKPAAP